MNLQEILHRKHNSFYSVKSGHTDLQVKDVDLEKNTVQFVGNTYNFMDSDQDVLFPGVAKKSIQERGVNSNAHAKIKHISDHKLDTNHLVGVPTLIEERNENGFDVLYLESKIPNTQQGRDHLIKYQEGLYDNHSIGFNYIDIAIADKESSNEDERNRYNKYISQIINKDDVEKLGYFFAVKEIALWEVSVVPFGANMLTPYLGSKSQAKADVMMLDLKNRLDAMSNHLRNGKSSDECMKELEIQKKMILQVMQDIKDVKTTEKNTRTEPVYKDADINYDYLLKHY